MSHKSNNRRPNQAKLYEALHKKRAAECEAKQQWAGVTQYFKTWENNSNMFTNWTSPQYYQKCSEQQLELRKQEQKHLEEQQEEINKWRKKIQDRQREDEEFKKGQMKKKPVSLSRPNSAGQKTPCEEMAMELKRKQDAVMDREIELKLHVRSKSCDPKQAKQYGMRERQRSSESAWDDRMEEKKSAIQKRQEQFEREQRLSEEQFEIERVADKNEHRNRQARAIQLKDDLISKVAELKKRSDRCEELKKLETVYLALQDQLKSIEHKNEELEQRKIQSLSRAKALRQYLTMLKQRSKEMVEFLREDCKLIEDLDAVLKNSNVEILESSRTNELRNLFNRYEDDECQRLYLMDFMFEEEARNMWRSQEERWKSEHVIRKSEVDSLFATLKTKLEEKIDKCLDEQRVLIVEREELICVIEKGNNELKQLESESIEFYKRNPDYYDDKDGCSLNSINNNKIENTAQRITDREQKLLAEMAQLNLWDGTKLTDHRRKKAVW